MGKMDIAERGKTLARARRLHHTAYVTHDAAATVAFYTEIMGLPLVSTVIDDRIPSTGDPYPYIHIFFEMEDGSTIAFFESLGLPKPSPISHPAYDIFQHLALDVGTKENVDRWLDHLKSKGIEVVGPTDHGIIYSIYFHDPNNIRLEFTATTDPGWKDCGEEAQSDVEDWNALRKRTLAEGSSAKAADWIRENRAKHKRKPVD